MPKIKSHSGAKKRFRKTQSGKWKYKKAGLQHLLTPDSSGSKRHLRKAAYLNKVQGEILRKYLPYK
ncbi:MAG: 50S ribosomal protein L35 [Elusimicrobia bacterium]|nr:50S ribosomal protein L35 [Elusimicrobiota bacterium]